MPDTGFEWDLISWFSWSGWIQDMGIGNIYSIKVNYHPVWLYFLYIYGEIQGSTKEIIDNVQQLKSIPLAFDFLTAVSIFCFKEFNIRNFYLPLLALLNIAFLYNSYIWGQVDSIPTFFVLLSIVLIYKEKVNWGIICFVLALYTKLQVIVFAPIVGLLLLPHFINNKRKILTALLVFIVSQVIILLPFILEETLDEFWVVVTEAVGNYTKVSLNAHNLWFLIFPEMDLGITEDTILFWNSTAHVWGLRFFISASLIVLTPLLIKVFLVIKNKSSLDDYMAMIFLSLALVALCFFYFNTQMHERYSHPCLIFFLIYGILKRRFLLYFLCSIAYFLNLENVLRAFEFNNYEIWYFYSNNIAILYGFIFIYGLASLYYFSFIEKNKLFKKDTFSSFEAQ